MKQRLILSITVHMFSYSYSSSVRPDVPRCILLEHRLVQRTLHVRGHRRSVHHDLYIHLVRSLIGGQVDMCCARHTIPSLRHQKVNQVHYSGHMDIFPSTGCSRRLHLQWSRYFN